jgi:hypothetical protein
MVTVLAAHEPFTPAGSPEKVAPVAPVVANEILVIAVLIHVVRLIPPAIVLFAVTVMVPVAFTEPHPPVRGME